jgi:photosystem II stability/assembly factor-like uncharacterized protein
VKLLILAFIAAFLAASWQSQTSGVTAGLRGVSAISAKVAWASGTGGTWLRTTDGGMTWQSGVVPDAEKLDFRGIRAFDDHTAILLSSGAGDLSRVFQTTDSGAHWTPRFTNPDPKGFFDGIAFWDQKRGIIAGDPVDGKFAIFTTTDGGQIWTRRAGPIAQPGEGAFAASNSCLTLRGDREAWLGTGGGRIFHSVDGGATWTSVPSGIRSDSDSSGVFSIAWENDRIGIAAGGDYRKETEGHQSFARTQDGGKVWKAIDGGGYRSAVLWLPERKVWIATGTSGTDTSSDDGLTWQTIDRGSYNALSASPDGAVWAVGPKGNIARLQ